MRAPRRKGLSEQDRDLWARYAQSLTPLDGRKMPEPPPEPEAPAVRPGPAPAPPPPRKVAQAGPLAVGLQPGGLDNASWNRLRSGKLTPQRTLDLHGRTVQRAYHALHHFLQVAQADQIRCVEIITGRGAGEGGGVLRRELPMWLNLPELRRLVLAASHPHAANPGSVRVLLRRTR